MTLGDTFLQKLSDWRPPEGRHVLPIPDEATGWNGTLTADRCDVLGCLVWELTLQWSKPAAAAALRTWAENTAQRVTGLLEPLSVIEVDTARGEALLRSREPARRGEQLFYYEVLLRAAGSALVRRYQSSHLPSDKRRQAAFALTHEVLAKLADDLAASLV